MATLSRWDMADVDVATSPQGCPCFGPWAGSRLLRLSELGEAVPSEVLQTEVLICSGSERISCHPSQDLLEDAVPTFPPCWAAEL